MMKIILILVPLSLTLAIADLSVKQIEKMVQKIHIKREGIALKTLDQTKEPFIRIKKEENKTVVVELPSQIEPDVKLTLHAIMGGKAYINNSWKKVGDVVMGYTVKYIGKRGVVLQNGTTIKKLFIGKPKEQLLILDERE